MPPEAARTVRELQMLENLVDCAHDLAHVFAGAAQAERDTKQSLEFLDGFLKCGLAVRMGIRLSMSLRAALRSAPAPAPAVERAEALECEPAEHDRPEREPREGVEREREYEPVSLPRFLATLGVVARDAGRLTDQLPGASRVLPTLQGLLAHATPDPPTPEPRPAAATSVAVLARPPQGAMRHQLLGSAATPLPGPRSGAPPPWSNSG